MSQGNTRWMQFFDEHLASYHGLLEYAVAHWNYNLPMFHHIQRVCPAPAKLLEVGCGLGVSAIYLQACGYQVTAVDNEPHIADDARKNARYFHSPIHVELADAFDLSAYHGEFDLVYSLGVLEHFERAMTIRLLQEQARCARNVLLGVPSRFTTPITDERIYTLSQLRRIIRETGLIPLKSFGYGNPRALILLHHLLPHVLYRICQDYFSLAQTLVVIGQTSNVDS